MTDIADRNDLPLTDIIAFSPVASVVTDPSLPDNPIIACNDAFMALTGYGKDEIIGRNCRFLSGPRTQPWLTDRIRKAVAQQKPILVELLNHRKDGSPFLNAVLVAPIFGDDGSLRYFLGSQVEIDDDSDAVSIDRRRKAAARIRDLSPRQREVLQEMAQGALNKQIAYRLNLSEKTVKMHRSLLIANLGVATSADAVRLAVEAGM